VGVMCASGDRERVVEDDILDDIFFSLVFFFVELVGI
jgi:hypothetical protein